MIGIEVKAAALGDFKRVWRQPRAIKRRAVEGCGRDEFRCRLTGIERSAARIAIDVDDRARKPRAQQRRAERRDKIIELVEAPIRVLARDPGIDESGLEPEEVCARVRNADDERRLAALDDDPVGTERCHCAGLSSPGSVAAPTASMTVPSLTSLVAVAMSG